ncbi:MAG: indolepyruvate oxidoreductase subunit beta [Candidatus Adiutrix sp.]|jgi:indolepyruvate ferredoxin oxidoreductase beta subunit|nr:indolepyruvate oxidoreductase subunit beta [Candidatus Adiutrix sp.]
MTDCLIAGLGGQGTILASRLLGAAALSLGLEVRGSETIGMAQRGGSVVSHVRLGPGAESPLIAPGRAEVILAFEPGEAVRALPFLKPDGWMIVSDREIKSFGPSDSVAAWLGYLRANVPHLQVLDGRKIAQNFGPRCLNVAILGLAAACGTLPCSVADLQKALEAKFEPRLAGLNKQALQAGAEMAQGG